MEAQTLQYANCAFGVVIFGNDGMLQGFDFPAAVKFYAELLISTILHYVSLNIVCYLY